MSPSSLVLVQILTAVWVNVNVSSAAFAATAAAAFVNGNVKNHANLNVGVNAKNTVKEGFVPQTHDSFLQLAKKSSDSTASTSTKRSIEEEEEEEEEEENDTVPLNYDGRIKYYDDDTLRTQHRCGFVSLIGAPNMGKSTLLNALLQETLCTATHRPQTTRHSILGVLSSSSSISDGDHDPCCCQLCFTDTPGVIDEPAYKLQEGMMEAVKGALVDSDVILVVTDLFSTPIPDDVTFARIKESDKVKIVVINKIDLVDRVNVGKSGDDDDDDDGNGNNNSNNKNNVQLYHKKTSSKEDKGDNDGEEEEKRYKRTVTVAQAVQNWREILPDALAIIPLTASAGGKDVGVVALRTLLMGGPDVPAAFRDLGRPLDGMFKDKGVMFLSNEEARGIIPYGPPLYDEDTLTDRSERFFASEIIRATLFCKLGKELPYCCEVIIDEFREPKPQDKRKLTRIMATICVERESQKGIVVGKGGVKIKDVGVEARKQLEEFLQEKVHLKLNVKVDKNWRRDESKLKAYGYLKK
eukprot:CAMPEP_0203668320 /NCGR_PEP_ID=MMETSP0090-20130426/4974_1 /ASSEMBLY_ACC=CAM_ASM_001088 /TAXON_ID=426623 /ORGANISM="Chaetoceros affinis, Strain CCMP159" /LENGTH=523 /DNA_ID=CAMNT_0050532721 /DNA_START=91 /DNA_END=1662 /DNA_ORIENTATION=+